jgi:hypothetical protein
MTQQNVELNKLLQSPSNPQSARTGSDVAVEISGDIFDVEALDVTNSPFDDGTEFEEPIISKGKRTAPPKADSKPPTADEWQNFFSRFIVRGITRGYLALVMRDIEDELTPADKERIRLTDDELNELAAPMASLSTKSAFMKKHGRTIVSAAESSEAFIGLFFWMRRVNKIAKKYRQQQPIQGYVTNVQTEMRTEPIDYGIDGQNDAGYFPGPRYNGNFGPGTSG